MRTGTGIVSVAQEAWPYRAVSRFARNKPAAPHAILVSLGSALMTRALTGLLESRGWPCSREERDSGPAAAVIVDAATINAELRVRHPGARMLFLEMEEGSRREAAISAHQRKQMDGLGDRILS